ncbi:hypothetical protein M0G43_10955 [Subsaxibacter sp. CAU 1640]|uniref:hypothetical protein n=1 Tax=Subsaxibacter sp. CAU 1640 TaxID=2933271 RepID=UPI00200554F4|nr:hypothetical protein [Subsaxibacter sp. CAU 1640]MCK7591094.1 hypothetical protein [Subsaxibacter sp. CAU 1640]
MKIINLLVIFIVICGCAPHNSKTIDNYEISNSVTLKLTPFDSLQVNELRFRPKFDSDDLQKFMFNKYGAWNHSIQSDRKENILVWENVKLLDDNEELFTIAVGGDHERFKTIKINDHQNYGQIFYCSAIVLDSKGFDCFKPSSYLKNKLATYLIMGAKSVNKTNVQFEKEKEKVKK